MIANWLNAVRSQGSEFDWFVDSSIGNDAYSGKSRSRAFSTIAKLLTVLQANQSVGLAKGSHWREQLTLSNASNTIEAYGTGASPILDAADIITGWSKTGGLTNVYEKSVATAAAFGEQYINVWEDDLPMQRVANAAACDGAAGSCYVTGASGTVTVYIHTSDSADPGANGKVYEVSVRNAGIFSQTNGHIITGITTQKNQSASGSLVVSRSATITDCVCKMGNKHNIYVSDGCYLENVQCIDQYYNNTSTLFVYNEGTPAGLGVTFVNCTASRPNTSAITGNGIATGFYGHKNTSGSFGTVTYTNCSAEDCYYGFDGQDATLVLSGCSTDATTVNSILVQTNMIGGLTLTNCTFSATSSCLLTQGTGGCTITISGGTFTDLTSNQACINVTVNNVTLIATGATFRTQYIVFTASAGVTGLVLTSNTNYLQVAFGFATSISTPAGSTTYTGDNNTYKTSQGNVINNVTYATLAALFAALGQDEHSTFVA